MTSIYLASTNPRWAPKTEADLQAAIDGGILAESHYLDLKESLAGKADNKELARDLASFAIDGGAVIVGIAEDKARSTFNLAPQTLKGLAERIEQATRTLTDPPLHVIADPIKADADATGTTGYLLVQVPASPVAPHMVDGRYMGRGDKTKYVLSDPEVVRLHQRRRVAEQDVLEILASEITNAPMQRVHAHLFLVAQPQAGRPDMLVGLTGAVDWNSRLAGLIERGHSNELNQLLKETDAAPTLRDAGNGSRRARGVARTSSNLGEGRVFAPASSYAPDDAIELQVFEDGGLRLFSSRFSDEIGGSNNEHVILDAAAAGLTRRFLAIVIAASEEAGYAGNWSLAIGATGLKGLRAYTQGWMSYGTTSRYDSDDYRQATAASWAELAAAPGAVTRRLIGPLLRSLGTENRFKTVLDYPEAPDAKADED